MLTGRDANCLGWSNSEGIGASEVAIKEITKVVDVMVRCEYACVKFVSLHVASYHIKAAPHLLS